MNSVGYRVFESSNLRTRQLHILPKKKELDKQMVDLILEEGKKFTFYRLEKSVADEKE